MKTNNLATIEPQNTEDVFSASEEKYRGLVQRIQDGIFIIRDGNILYANEGFAKVMDYHAEELIGKSIKEFIAPEYLALVTDRNAQRMKGGHVPSEYDFSLVKKDGVTRVDALINLTAINYEGGLAVMGVSKDIAERRKAEEKLDELLINLRKSIKTTIQVLGMASEVRDPYTAVHQKRVSNLALAIAKEKGLPTDKIEGIRMASSIHDIGKISVPSDILSKPTQLNNIEISMIKEHSHDGYEMLKHVYSPWPLAEIVHQHHERMNGAGYPRNLKGNEILMEARILAVADVVEAMATHRPYRASLGLDAALKEIETNKGILYDNSVANACLRLFREKGYQLTYQYELFRLH
jgi:PAS domain S-box-containing protein